jgi:phosphoglycolate phosphatase
VTMRAVLLDLDGTLIDSLPGIRASCLATLRALGHVPDPATDFTSLVGPPLPQVMARLLLPYGDDRIDAAVAAYRAHYAEAGMYEATPYPGIPAMLDALRAAGAVLFVATSKRTMFARPILQRLGLAGRLHGIYGTEPDGSLDHKTQLVAALLRAEGLDARETVMAGDRSHDMIGARANGVRAIGVLWGYGSRGELEAAGADRLVASPDEMPALCGSLSDLGGEAD